MGIDRLSGNVSNYQSTLSNIKQELRYNDFIPSTETYGDILGLRLVSISGSGVTLWTNASSLKSLNRQRNKDLPSVDNPPLLQDNTQSSSLKKRHVTPSASDAGKVT
jgi:hypothetical protein